MGDEFSKDILHFLNGIGIDPIYFSTIIILIIHIIFDRKKYREWNTLTDGEKFYFVVTIIAVLVFIIFSLLNLLGVFSKLK